MRVADVGEFGLIDLVAKTISDFKPADVSPHLFLPPVAPLSCLPVLIDIGDDTAAWRTGSPVQFATTDTLVQDVHFSLSFATWRELGWKSLAVNVSDIAAMGGLPRYALVTLGLPGNLEVDAVIGLYQGMMDLALRCGVAVVGGDMVRAKEVFITVAMTGEASPEAGARTDYLLRSRARPGDKIAITGFLGSSAAGLKMLSHKMTLEPEAVAYLREAHLRPAPRILEGLLIRRSGGLSAMDISDGLLADLSKLCKASGVGGTLRVDKLPIHPIVRSAFPDEADSLALSGGEDYELLFTARDDVVNQVRQGASVPVTVVGEVTEDETGKVRVLDPGGRETWPKHTGWDHFGGGRW